MTQKEVSELFALWSLNWPNSELFKGGSEMLDARIKLYADALRHVDFWTGQRATAYALANRVYAPNISEFLSDINSVSEEIKREIDSAYMELRDYCKVRQILGSSLGDTDLSGLSPRVRKVIEAMGGLEVFVQPDKNFYNLSGFSRTYESLLKKNPPMLQAKRKELT